MVVFEVNKAHESSTNRSGCHEFGCWFIEQEEQSSDESQSGKHFSLFSNPVKVYYGSIIKDKIPVVLPVEELSSGWQNGHMMYTFTRQYCNKLDELSDAFRKEFTLAESNEGESDLDSESEDNGGQQVNNLVFMRWNSQLCSTEDEL